MIAFFSSFFRQEYKRRGGHYLKLIVDVVILSKIE
jgi:hypothetical protein